MALEEVRIGDPHAAAHNEERAEINRVSDLVNKLRDDLYSALGIEYMNLTKNEVVSTTSWDKRYVKTLVVVQNSVGGKKLTIDEQDLKVNEDALSETVVSGIWTGMRWLVRTSEETVGGAAPVAPVWVAGTTATTGSPADTSVVVAFSNNIPSGYLQYRYGPSDTWRSATASGRNVTLSDLSPSTSYAAPQFQVINAAGSTDVISAQAFTTLAKVKKWTPYLLANFNAPDGTLIEDYTPDVGDVKFTRQDTRAKVDIFGGKTRVTHTGTNYLNPDLKYPLTSGDFYSQAVMKYELGQPQNSIGYLVIAARATGEAGSNGIRFNATKVNGPDQGTFTEVTGKTTLPPTSGTATFTYTATDASNVTFTLSIDGVEYRKWTGSWTQNYGPPLYFTRCSFAIGGGDINSETPVSGVKVDSITLNEWK